MLPRTMDSEARNIGDAFARRAVLSRKIWTVSGAEGLARLPSRNRPGREAMLCWSSEETAQRFALRAARNPRVNPIMLSQVMTDVLPKQRALNRLVLPDWSGEPFHPEFEPGQIALRLKGEAIVRFCAATTEQRRVYILEDDIGPAFAASQANPDKLTLPLWVSSEDAEFQVRRFWSEMAVSEIPVSLLIEKTLPFVAGIGRGVSLDHGLGGVPTEMSPVDLSGRLMRCMPERRIA